MHIVESYATNLGLKIDKPEIYEKYYPVGDFEYITLYLGGGGEQIHYHHWQDVINLAFPMLEKQNIKIIQLNGALQQKFNNCINVPESLSCNNLSYVIKNSKLHISENSLDLEFFRTGRLSTLNYLQFLGSLRLDLFEYFQNQNHIL